MKTKKTRRAPLAPGIAHINTQLPNELLAAMKAIQAGRRRLEGSTPRLCLLYKEAVEMYINSKPNQQLLNGTQKALKKTA